MQNSALITLVGIVTKMVLVLLVVLSIYSFAIILDRKKFFRGLTIDQNLIQFLSKLGQMNQVLMNQESTQLSPYFKDAVHVMIRAEQNSDAITYSLKSYISLQKLDAQKGLSLLGTLGSNAPFIGLFGTVLGIIQSFAELTQSQNAMNSVMFSLAEALIATAVGLMVAIPAVIAYNVFNTRLKVANQAIEAIKDAYLAQL